MTKKLITEKKRTNRPVSVLMKMTMSAMLLALVTVRAENLTIPQLEYRYDDAKASVKSTEKALDKAMDAFKDAQKASRKASDNLLEEKGDLAKLKADGLYVPQMPLAEGLRIHTASLLHK